MLIKLNYCSHRFTKNRRFTITYGDSILIVFKITIIIAILMACEKNEFLEKNIAASSCFPAEQSNAYRILPSAYNNWMANQKLKKKNSPVNSSSVRLDSVSGMSRSYERSKIEYFPNFGLDIKDLDFRFINFNHNSTDTSFVKR